MKPRLRLASCGARRPAWARLRVALVAALALTLGCRGETGTAQNDPQAAGVGGSAGIGQVDGGTGDPADPALNEAIAIALPQLPRRLDPHDDLEPWAMRIAEDLVFEGLVRRTGDRYPWTEPAIADRCEVDREYAVASITCHIPSGIRFHDGTELTIDDVVYSLTYWLDRRRVWIRQRHGLTNFSSVEVVDGPRGGGGDRDPGRWVRIGLDKRDPLALEALAAVKIVPREAHRGRETQFAQHPIGTGPMAITTLGQDRVVAERFPDYHDPERRAVAGKIVFRAIADGAHALTALRRGEIHLLPELAPVHVPVELGKPGMSGRFAAWLVSPPQYDLLLWNVASGIQANAPLRGVMHDALPISAIAREIYGAPGLAAAAPVDLHEPTPIDLEALEDIKLGEPVRGGLLVMPSLDDDIAALVGAAAGLDALEWPLEQGIRRRPGGSLRISVTWDARSGRPAAIVSRIVAAWESIGVVTPEATAGWNYVLVLLGKGEFKTALLHFGGHSDEDLYELFHSRGTINFAGVADEELDRALSDYRGAPDRAARDRAKQQIAERLAQLRVVSMLHAPSHVMLASRRLTGIEFVDDIPRLDRLGLIAGDIDWGT
ncbi:ABC transporter substrate-binding protein [Enhygromyxa salina]|nr:ABC transporter substrate-binding protein [Enhygromyxa salina]